MHPQIMAVINYFYEHRSPGGLQEPDRQRSYYGMTIPARDGRRFIVPKRMRCGWIHRGMRAKPQYERQSGTSKSIRWKRR